MSGLTFGPFDENRPPSTKDENGSPDQAVQNNDNEPQDTEGNGLLRAYPDPLKHKQISALAEPDTIEADGYGTEGAYQRVKNKGVGPGNIEAQRPSQNDVQDRLAEVDNQGQQDALDNDLPLGNIGLQGDFQTFAKRLEDSSNEAIQQG